MTESRNCCFLVTSLSDLSPRARFRLQRDAQFQVDAGLSVVLTTRLPGSYSADHQERVCEEPRSALGLCYSLEADASMGITFSPRGQQTFIGQRRESHSSQGASYKDILMHTHKAI